MFNCSHPCLDTPTLLTFIFHSWVSAFAQISFRLQKNYWLVVANTSKIWEPFPVCPLNRSVASGCLCVFPLFLSFLVRAVLFYNVALHTTMSQSQSNLVKATCSFSLMCAGKIVCIWQQQKEGIVCTYAHNIPLISSEGSDITKWAVASYMPSSSFIPSLFSYFNHSGVCPALHTLSSCSVRGSSVITS